MNNIWNIPNQKARYPEVTEVFLQLPWNKLGRAGTAPRTSSISAISVTRCIWEASRHSKNMGEDCSFMIMERQWSLPTWMILNMGIIYTIRIIAYSPLSSVRTKYGNVSYEYLTTCWCCSITIREDRMEKRYLLLIKLELYTMCCIGRVASPKKNRREMRKLLIGCSSSIMLKFWLETPMLELLSLI
jgi:hypothetical protein